MKTLITGANGFVGKHLCRLLEARGDAVISAGGPVGEDHAAVVDITRPDEVNRLLASTRPEAIVHLAGFASVGQSHADPAAAFAVNAQGTVHLLQAARQLERAPRVLLISSGEVYGRQGEGAPVGERTERCPLSPYASSKLAAEEAGFQFARAYGLPVVVARPFNHLGTGQAPGFVVPSFARQVKAIAAGAEPVIHVGDLTPVRDFSHVDDVVEAYALLLDAGVPGEAYNIASGVGRTIRSILDELLALAGVRAEVRIDSGRLRPAELPVLVGDASKLRALGWTPRKAVADALRDVLAETAA